MRRMAYIDKSRSTVRINCAIPRKLWDMVQACYPVGVRDATLMESALQCLYAQKCTPRKQEGMEKDESPDLSFLE